MVSVNLIFSSDWNCRGHYVMAYVSVASVSVNIASIIGQTHGSIDPIFLWLIGGDYRKVPFDDQLRRSSKKAATTATTAILDFGFRRL
jgi:hypothetical protein